MLARRGLIWLARCGFATKRTIRDISILLNGKIDMWINIESVAESLLHEHRVGNPSCPPALQALRPRQYQTFQHQLGDTNWCRSIFGDVG